MSTQKMMAASLMASILFSGCAGNNQQANNNNHYLLNQATTQEKPSHDSAHHEIDHLKAAELNVRLGLSYLEKGQNSRAKDKLNRALKLSPKSPEPHYALGIYFEKIGETANAKQAYSKAISLNPKGGIEHNNYGAFLCRQGQYLAAEKEFLTALKDPAYTRTAEAYENAGLCVLQIPDVAKAESYFHKSLLRDKNRPNASLELGYISFKNNNLEAAQTYHDNYIRHASPTARSLWLGIKLAEHQNDKNKVSSYSLLLKNRYPTSYEYNQLLKESA